MKQRLFLSRTKNCEMPFELTHTKPRETLEFELTEPRKTFCFKPYINLGVDSKGMMGLTSLDVYNSIFYNRRK